jgi:hypothetical protein
LNKTFSKFVAFDYTNQLPVEKDVDHSQRNIVLAPAAVLPLSAESGGPEKSTVTQTVKCGPTTAGANLQTSFTTE